MIYSKGISWLDDTRIPFVDEKVPRLNVSYEHKTNNNFGGGNDKRHGTSTQSVSEGQGRFTPNLLCCDDVLNDGNITKTNTKGQIRSEKRNWVYTGENKNNKMSNITDKGSSSRYYNLDLWFNKMIYGL